ncbi:MAG: hypothetical protein QW611_03925 [Ignisphaera sp.]
MSIYKEIAECVEREDSECLWRLVNTPEFQFLVSELAQTHKFTVEDIVWAIAVSVSMGKDVPDIKGSVETVLDTYTFSNHIKEGRYIDALNMVLSKPDIVTVLNYLNKSNLSIDDIVYSLSVYALDKDEKSIDTLKKIMSMYPQFSETISTAFKYHVATKIEELFSRDIKSSINYVKTVANTFDKDIAVFAYAYLLKKINETGADESIVQEVVNLGRSLGLITQDIENTISEEASKLFESVVDAMVSALFDEIRSALSENNMNKLYELLNRYRDVLSIYPTIVIVNESETRVLNDLSLAEYLDAVYKYRTIVEPIINSINRMIEDINNIVKTLPKEITPDNAPLFASSYSTIERLAKDIVSKLKSLSNYIDVLSILNYASNAELNRNSARDLTIRNINSMIDFYTDVSRYASSVSIYASRIYPLILKINRAVENATNLAKEGKFSEASSNLRQAIEDLKNVLQYVSVIAELNYRQMIEEGINVSREKVEKDVYRDLVDRIDNYMFISEYFDTLSNIDKLVQRGDRQRIIQEIEKLRKFFDRIPESRRVYAEYKLFYTAGPDDIAAILGEGNTPLINEIKALGVLNDIVNERRRELGTLIAAIVSVEIKNNPEKGRRILSLALSRGYNGELTSLNRVFKALEDISEIVSNVNKVMDNAARVGSIDAVEQAMKTIESALTRLKTISASYVTDLLRFEVEGGGTLYDALRSIINALEFMYGIYSTYVNTHKQVTKLENELINAKTIDDQIRISNEIARIASNAYNNIDRLCKAYKQNTDTYALPYKVMHQQYVFISAILSSIKTIDDNINRLIEALQRGVRVPEDASLVIYSWRNIIRELKAIDSISRDEALTQIDTAFTQTDSLKRLLEGEARVLPGRYISNLARDTYNQYLKYLSDLKTRLVQEDIRLEDWLNEAEKREGFSINYTKPYIDVPVLRELEKVVKIGLKTYEDIQKRKIELLRSLPIVGEALSKMVEIQTSIVLGFLSAVTALLRPSEFLQNIQFLYGGGVQLVDALIKRDLNRAGSVIIGGANTVLRSLYENITRDPAKFIGSLIGSILLAYAGAKIVNKIYTHVKIPFILKLKPLVINFLQADPLGLLIDYIALPIAKFGISKFAVAWSITKNNVGRIVKCFVGNPLKRVVDAVGNKITALSKQLKSIATFVKLWESDLSKLVQIVDSIKNKHGLLYLRALIDYVQNVNQMFRDIYNNISAIVSDIHKKRQVAAVARLSALNIIDNILPVQTLITNLQRLKMVFGLKLKDADISRLLKMDVQSLVKLKNSIFNAMNELATRMDKISSSVNRFLTKVYRDQDLKSVYEKYAKEFKNLDNLSRSNPVKALSDATELITRIAREVNVDAASKLGKMLLDELQTTGLTDIATSLSRVIDSLNKSASVLRKAITQFVDTTTNYVINPLKQTDITKFIDLDKFASILKKSASDFDINVITRAINDFALSIDNLINTIRSVDVAVTLRDVLQRLVSDINNLKKVLTEAGLNEFKYISDSLAQLDSLSKILNSKISSLNDIIKKLSEAVKPEDVADIARKLGLNDIADRILREKPDLNSAVNMVSEAIALRTVTDVFDVIKRISNYVESIAGSPQFTALRSLASNIILSIDAKIPLTKLTQDIVSLLTEIKTKYGSSLPEQVVKSIDECINNPTIDKFTKVLDAIGSIDPVRAAGLDIELVSKLTSLVNKALYITSQFEGLSNLVKNLNIEMPSINKMIKNITDSVNNIKKVLEFKYTAEFKLVDPGLINAVAEAGKELKTVFKFMSKDIDKAVSTIQKFLEYIDKNDFASAAKMYGSVMDALSFIGRLGLTKSILDLFKSGFINLKNKLLELIKKTPTTDVNTLKSVSDAVNTISSFLERFGVIEPKPGYGFIASSVEDIIGFTMKAPIEALDNIYNILSVKRKTMNINVGGSNITVHRDITKSAMGLDIKYTIDTPNGKAAIELRVSTVNFDPNTKQATNVITINAWYDPPLQNTVIAKALSDNLKNGINWLKTVDPDIEYISKIVTYAPNEVSLGSAIMKGAILLSSMLQPVLNNIANALMSQPASVSVIEKLPSIEPVPDDLFNELMKRGITPIGRFNNIVVGHINDISSDTKFISINLSSGESIIALMIPSLGVAVIPVYKPSLSIEPVSIQISASINLDELIKQSKAPLDLKQMQVPEIKQIQITPPKDQEVPEMQTPQMLDIVKKQDQDEQQIPKPVTIQIPGKKIIYITPPGVPTLGGMPGVSPGAMPGMPSTGSYASVTIGRGTEVREKLQI